MSTALVLGGGGVTGIAWELGVLHALQEAGVDLTAADLVVGTSAGSVVAVQATSGIGLHRLVADQLEPAGTSQEVKADFDPHGAAAAFTRLIEGARDAREIRARIGAMALAAPTVLEAERMRTIQARLPVDAWPGRRLLITAVDAQTGNLVVWDRTSGIPLASAVAASCAVPGVWPPATVAGRRYIDGSVRSATNADLALGHDVVVVLAPDTGPGLNPASPGLTAEVALLRAHSQVHVITPDDAALEAIGPNPLDPGRRPPSARAGRRQGRELAATLRGIWPAPAA
ncbi:MULTISPECIES: patatin-like phospholipase family protein [unclassified Streptomyces]|uniref:patatin-like phospholipase family protein n=1 Tax=unclassified Streptomyces TaxID=2593676 RepID=UPI003D8F7D92